MEFNTENWLFVRQPSIYHWYEPLLVLNEMEMMKLWQAANTPQVDDFLPMDCQLSPVI